MRVGTSHGRARPGVFATLAGALLASAIAAALAADAAAQTNAQRLKLLEQTVKELLARDEARERKMKAMEAELKRLRGGRGLATVAPKDKPAHDDHDHDHGKKPDAGKEKIADDHAGHDHGHKAGEDSAGHADDHAAAVWSAEVGGGVLRLSRIGLDADFAAGAGTAEDEEMESLFGGHHDPKRTGFTLQTADLSISGGYDPYFDAFFNLTFTVDEGGETGVEIEEAWVRSKWAAKGSFRVKAGQFYTAFGAVNPTHLHDWAWQTQPVIATRMFGADGARGLGVETEIRLSDAPWQSTAFMSMQNRRNVHAHGHGGDEEEEHELSNDRLDDFVFLFRFRNRLTPAPGTSLTVGGSAMFEPNPNGNETPVSIFGADLELGYRLSPESRFVLAAEYMHRNAKEVHEEQNETEIFSIQDYGFYVQGILHTADGFGFGLRYEYANGRGGEVDERRADPMRGSRTRISPLLLWQFSEFGRLKVQYNYDRAEFLSDGKYAHSLFASTSWSFGLGVPDHAGHAH